MIFALYVILCVAGAVVAALLLFRNKCHPVCSLLLAAIGLSALSQLLFMIHYATYTVDGRGLPKALAAAFYVAACADTLMCAVCILCAQGYNIVRRKLRGRTRMHVAIFSTTYVVANICVVAWHSLGGGAKGTSIFLYDSPSGYLFLFLRCLTAIWILRAAIQMQAHFRAKAGFYYRFCIVAATWVCAAPFVALVASLSPESERLKVSMVLEPAIVLLSQVGLLFLFTPLRILNEHFPFHSETTKQLSAPILGKWKDERVSVAAPGGGGGGGFGARLAAASEAAGGPVDTRSFAAISGGRGRGVDSRGRYVVSDGFEALHVLRLKRVQAALETRLAPLGDLARQLLEAMEHIDVDTVYDDEDDDDDGEGDGRRSEDSHGALHLTAAPLKQAPPLKRSFGAPRPPAHSPLALASAAGRAHRGDGRRGYNADADSSFEGEAKHQAAPSPDRSLESPERRSMASSPDTPRSPLLETDVDGGASHFGDGAFSDDGGGDSSPAREPPPTRTTPRVLGGGTRVLGGGARVLPPL